jgi:antitoxin YefM
LLPTANSGKEKEMATKSFSSSEVRNNLDSILQGVVDDAEPIVIRLKDNQNVVIISEDEYNSLLETAYVTSGRNGDYLRESIAEAQNGKTTPITLQEIDDLIDDHGFNQGACVASARG